jgi:hypothetical protein
MTVSQDTIANLERVLKQADLVKFAKSKPLDLKLQRIEIKYKRQLTLDSSIPVEIEIEEDALLNEVQKTETDPNSTKEKRSKRIFIAVAAVLSYC